MKSGARTSATLSASALGGAFFDAIRSPGRRRRARRDDLHRASGMTQERRRHRAHVTPVGVGTVRQPSARSRERLSWSTLRGDRAGAGSQSGRSGFRLPRRRDLVEPLRFALHPLDREVLGIQAQLVDGGHMPGVQQRHDALASTPRVDRMPDERVSGSRLRDTMQTRGASPPSPDASVVSQAWGTDTTGTSACRHCLRHGAPEHRCCCAVRAMLSTTAAQSEAISARDLRWSTGRHRGSPQAQHRAPLLHCSTAARRSCVPLDSAASRSPAG